MVVAFDAPDRIERLRPKIQFVGVSYYEACSFTEPEISRASFCQTLLHRAYRDSQDRATKLAREPKRRSTQTTSHIEHFCSGLNPCAISKLFDQSDLGLARGFAVPPKTMMNMFAPKVPIKNR